MTAVVTGASSGLGKCIAQALSRRGYDLVLVARREDRLMQLAEELPVKCMVLCMDLSVPGQCYALWEQTKEMDVSVLINAAGFGVYGRFSQTSLERELTMLDLNIKAPHILTKLYLKTFQKRGKGYIMNVASSAGYMAGPFLSSYYAAKSYVLRLSQAVFEEESGGSVRVCAFCPGPVDTEFNRNAGIHASVKPMAPEKAAEYGVKMLFKGKRVIVPGFSMKAGLLAARLLPEGLLIKITRRIQEKKALGSERIQA